MAWCSNFSHFINIQFLISSFNSLFSLLCHVSQHGIRAMVPTLKLVFAALALSSYWIRIFLPFSLSFTPFSPCPNTVSISFFFTFQSHFPRKLSIFSLLYFTTISNFVFLDLKKNYFSIPIRTDSQSVSKVLFDFHRFLEMLHVHLLLRSDSRFKTIIDAKPRHQFFILLMDPFTDFRFGFGSMVHVFSVSLSVRFSLYISSHVKSFLASSTSATMLLHHIWICSIFIFCSPSLVLVCHFQIGSSSSSFDLVCGFFLMWYVFDRVLSWSSCLKLHWCVVSDYWLCL